MDMDEPSNSINANEPVGDSSDHEDTSSDFAVSQEELEECRELCLRPLSRAIHEDVLSVLSPTLWIGLARLRRVPLDAASRSLRYLILPPVLYSAAAYLVGTVVSSSRLLLFSQVGGRRGDPGTTSSMSRLPSPRSLLLSYALSPWTLYHAYRACQPIATLAAQVLAFRTVFRSRVLDEAVVELGRRIRQNRARRHPMYDLYLPPPKVPPSSSMSSSLNVPATTYVLFVPGAGVSPISYSRPASWLSDAGMVVAVINTEKTLRLSSHHVGYTTDAFRAIQLDVLSSSQQPQQTLSSGSNAAAADEDHVNLHRWVGVGHSMGCFTLSHVDWRALQLRKVAFWGISPMFVQDLADLSSSGNDGRKVLIVKGSDDALNRMAANTNPDLERQLYAKLPDSQSSNLATRVVEGGTHRGFASYESRLLPEPQSYGDRDRQQRRTVDLTAPFLLADD